MNKDKLQQEILAKIKPGTKPSDLKKRKLVQPKPQKDDGYQSDKLDKIPTAPPLLNQQVKDLQVQVSALQKQLQLYKDFRESDLKIKESYKQELTEKNKTLTELQSKLTEQDKTIADLKNQTKTTANNSAEPTETKTFTCSDCNQEKPQNQLSRVFGNFSFCLECSKKARQQAQQEKTTPEPITFTCHLCEQSKTEIPNQIKLDKTLTDYLICGSCKPTAKEFNEADLITDELWEKYPYSSASEILELEFGIVRK